MIIRAFAIFILFSGIPCLSQEIRKDSLSTFVPGMNYTGDLAVNFHGGLKKGSTYLGMLNINLTTNIWKGASLFISGSNTHGGQPSADLTGDYQIASNIEAGNHIYMQELWLRQNFNIGEVTIGLQDVNVDFANTAYGLLFLNSSFGVIPTISGNVPAPIFPLTSLGISSKWQILKRMSLLFATYDGRPTDFSDNPHNLSWKISKNDGLLMFSELQYLTGKGHLTGILKAGYYLHQHFFKDDQIDTTCRNNHGFYLSFEHEVWKNEGGKGAGFFFQLGLSPASFNRNLYYSGFGLNITGLISEKRQDILGISVAHDGLRGFPGKETTLEITWKLMPVELLYIQPDVQYIINPAGTGEKLKNSLLAILRFGISL